MLNGSAARVPWRRWLFAGKGSSFLFARPALLGPFPLTRRITLRLLVQFPRVRLRPVVTRLLTGFGQKDGRAQYGWQPRTWRCCSQYPQPIWCSLAIRSGICLTRTIGCPQRHQRAKADARGRRSASLGHRAGEAPEHCHSWGNGGRSCSGRQEHAWATVSVLKG